MENKISSMSDADLAALVARDEHNEYEDDHDDEYSEWIHAYWDCATCDAENEIGRRKHVAESRLPGRCPLTAKTHKSIRAGELSVGMFARYLSRPGVSDYPYEYAEALSVKRIGDAIEVEWRMTNSPDSPVFHASYAIDDSLRVSTV